MLYLQPCRGRCRRIDYDWFAFRVPLQIPGTSQESDILRPPRFVRALVFKLSAYIAMDDLEKNYRRYLEFQRYVAWSDYDVQRLTQVSELIEPYLAALVDDFYEEIGRHPNAYRVITGGKEQVSRLKVTLRSWLGELFSGNYDREYLQRRWNVGRRHVEIGLDQAYTITAIARLRTGLLHALKEA